MSWSDSRIEGRDGLCIPAGSRKSDMGTGALIACVMVMTALVAWGATVTAIHFHTQEPQEVAEDSQPTAEYPMRDYVNCVFDIERDCDDEFDAVLESDP